MSFLGNLLATHLRKTSYQYKGDSVNPVTYIVIKSKSSYQEVWKTPKSREKTENISVAQ